MNKILFIVFILFLGACSSPSVKYTSGLSKDEVLDLEFFLNYVLFENHGAFVLFGSKPLVQTFIFDRENAKKKEPDCERISLWERDLFRGWVVYEKIRSNQIEIEEGRYLFFIHSMDSENILYNLYLIDVNQVAVVLAKYYDLFKKITEVDFNPISIVYEIKDPDSIFWNKVLLGSNHLAKGLLFGCGEKNSLFFAHQVESLKENDLQSRSIQKLSIPNWSDEKLTFGKYHSRNFNIPPFRIAETSQVEKYQREKRKIEIEYRRKNFITLSLDKLFDRE